MAAAARLEGVHGMVMSTDLYPSGPRGEKHWEPIQAARVGAAVQLEPSTDSGSSRKGRPAAVRNGLPEPRSYRYRQADQDRDRWVQMMLAKARASVETSARE